MIPGARWYAVQDGDPRARWLVNRHYSAIQYKDGRRPKKFIGPGEYMALMTVDCKALFVWRKWRNPDGNDGIYCVIFRNEGPFLSSELIQEAEELAWRRWPGERLYTYINPDAVESTNPGYCFKVAGWSKCGVTKVNKLHILEKLPGDATVCTPPP